MITRMSRLFPRTLREDPADAELASHRLLARAGYVRRVAPGIFSWLPLGLRVLHNVERVVREEMDAIGAQEVHLPALLPAEAWAASGRLAEYGAFLFQLRDRREVPYVLGSTHEEFFTALVKGELSSYRDYPLALYQIQTKYRDEARPRGGLLRGREFVMKDSYSFDLDDAGLAASYAAHRAAYVRIFDRLGFDYRVVSAVSGAMGGSASEEFLAVADSGEDTFVVCRNCSYAANIEALEMAVPPAQDPAAHPPVEVLDTPGTPTIESLVTRLREVRPGREWTAADTLKNVVLVARAPGGKEELLVVGVPGDREVDVRRVAGQLDPIEVAPATEADLAREPGLVAGYIGPRHLADMGLRYLVDPLVVPGSAWVTGADEPGRHAANIVRGRDFEPAGEVGAVVLRATDRCPRCGGELAESRGIEIGHIFQLGRKYADIAGLDALGPDGRPVRVTMGSYGIGVTRAVAALAEQRHDAHGLCWPAEVAPARVHVVGLGRDGAAREYAERAAHALDEAGLAVILDDREVSPGVAFADAELLGVPTVLVAGRSLTRGVVEVRNRATGSREEVAADTAVAGLLAAGEAPLRSAP